MELVRPARPGADVQQQDEPVQPVRVFALLEALGGEFAVDRATLEADVLPFLERLLAAGAIVLSSAGSDGP